MYFHVYKIKYIYTYICNVINKNVIYCVIDFVLSCADIYYVFVYNNSYVLLFRHIINLIYVSFWIYFEHSVYFIEFIENNKKK